MTGLVVLGGSGHASDVLSILETVSHGYQRIVMLDEGTPEPDRFAARDVTIAPTMDHAAATLGDCAQVHFVSGVGYPAVRQELVGRAAARGWIPAIALTHGTVEIMAQATIAEGSVVMGFVWISPAVSIAEHVYVGYGAKLGHDAAIGAHSSLFPGCFVGGSVTIGEACLIGANASILPGVSIGAGSHVGAGAVVTQDVSPGTTVLGVPARPRFEA